MGVNVIVNNKSTLRFYELDLLRLLAAFAVVLFHYTAVLPNSIENSLAPTYPLLESIFKYGFLGVQFFFMISGFVILLTASKKNWQGFVISRISRLYPAFWIALTITTLAILLLDDNKTNFEFSQYFWNLTMVPEYIGIENIDAVYWTLQVEIKFYFWIFIIMLFKKLHYIKIIIFFWLILSILSTFNFKYDYSHNFLIPQWAPYFSAGAIFYMIKTQGKTKENLAILTLSYCLSVYYAIDAAKIETEIFNLNYSSYIITMIITCYFAIFLFIIRSNKRRHFNKAWFVTLGGISYPLYLLHNKLGEILLEKLSGKMDAYLLLFLNISLMLVISFILYRYFEKKLAKGVKHKLENSFMFPSAKSN